jgi:5-methylcytosine-specific restriction protein A
VTSGDRLCDSFTRAGKDRQNDLDLDKRGGLLDDRDPEVVGLSRVLNDLPGHAMRGTSPTFRNANDVAMKLGNFARFDPSYSASPTAELGRRIYPRL